MGATFTHPVSAPISLEMALSLLSVMMTAYFWLVKSRRERPNLLRTLLSKPKAWRA